MAAVTAVSTWTDKTAEQTMLDSISIEAPWSLVEDMVQTIRLSGTGEERRAFEMIIARLTEWGVPYTLHEPEAFISHPLAATVRTTGADSKSFRAKTAAMSVSTDGQEIEGELIYIPGNRGVGYSPADIFAAGVDLDENSVEGKIVITEGMALPGKVTDLIKNGALAGIFVNPGANIHEGICTPIWGTPDLDNYMDQPTIPVAAVNNPSGLELIELAKSGVRVALSTTLETKWRTIPILVADIKGTIEPDKYVLLHGHVDGWHYGAGDNITGDATIAEIARVFNENKGLLKRSLKLAWWSGHSHGRYAGSTWFADEFAIDLANNALAQVNCDSPGCRWADTYNHLTTFSEARGLVHSAISEITGIVPEMERPVRAGDYSFNGIGISGFYMLSSTMSEATRAEKEYYSVGGCGANIEWHTEDDLIHILDKDILLRDIRMYAGSILRVINAPVVPFDFTAVASEFRETLSSYQAAADDLFDFAPAFAALSSLDAALSAFYSSVSGDLEVGSAEAMLRNNAQLRLARILIPINYSRAEAFHHDPALPVKALPDLAPALTAPTVKDDVAKRGILRTSLTRGQNRVVWALQMAAETVAAVS